MTTNKKYLFIFIAIIIMTVSAFHTKVYDDSDDKIDDVDKPRLSKRGGKYCKFSRPYRNEFYEEKDGSSCMKGYILREYNGITYCAARCFSGTLSLNDPLRCKIVTTCQRDYHRIKQPILYDCDYGMHTDNKNNNLKCYSNNECLGNGYTKIRNQPYCIPPHYKLSITMNPNLNVRNNAYDFGFNYDNLNNLPPLCRNQPPYND